MACPYAEAVFVGLLCLVRRPLSNLVKLKLKRNDLRKISGLFISKGFLFSTVSRKNCGNSLTLLPSVEITTRWWALKIMLIFS